MTPRVLDMRSDLVNRSRGGRVTFPCSLPWLRVTEVHATAEAAFAAAKTWADNYVRGASWARSADALGVAERPGGWVGVINYYHSNS